MADDLLGLTALRATAARCAELGRILGDSPDRTETYEGTDETAAVRAVVVADGTVTEVRVERDWRRRMHRNALTAAVLTAIDVADAARLRAWAERVGPSSDAVMRSVAPPDATPTAPTGPPVELSADRAARTFATVADLMDLTRRAGDELRAGANEPVAGSGTSGGGHVTVRITGKRVVRIEFDDETNWDVVASVGEIESELVDALRAGYRAVAAAQERNPLGAALAELRSLTADPRKLAELLFDGPGS